MKGSVWFFAIESILLMLGLLLLFLHAAFFRTPFILIPLLPIQCWNFTIEMIELNSKKTAYFKDLWNLFDMLRFIFTFVYFAVAMSDSPSQTAKSTILTVLALSQSVKAFSIFSLFKGTRVLLRIVIEIVKDMVPFFLFVLATTLTITLLYTSAILEDNLHDRSYPDLLMHVFLLDFGDFSADEYTPLEQCIFILSAIMVPLVLLNMLIAIMGDTFDRVKEDQDKRDFHEMAGLVYRYETIANKLCCSKK